MCVCVCVECKSSLPCLVSKFSHKPCCRFTHKKTSPRIHQDTIAIKLPVRVLCCFVSHPPSLLTSRKFASKSCFASKNRVHRLRPGQAASGSSSTVAKPAESGRDAHGFNSRWFFSSLGQRASPGFWSGRVTESLELQTRNSAPSRGGIVLA